MSFFSFSPDGRTDPGVSPDAPPKTGFARWRRVITRNFGALWLSGSLAFLALLPWLLGLYFSIATHTLLFLLAVCVCGGLLAGPFFAALTDIIFRGLRDEPFLWRDAWSRALRRNARESLAPGVLCCTLYGVQFFTLRHLEPGGAAAKASEREVAGDGARVTLRVEDFQVERYEGAESYSLLRHEGGRWLPVGTPERRGDVVTLGGESWPVSSLRRVAQMPQPFLLLPGEPPRLLVQHEAPVKDYRARCRWVIHRAGEADEERVESLRVNEPVACAGRLFYLMSYRPLGHGGVEVELLVRRAPGRFLMLLGLVGAVLCTACWSLGRRKPQGRSEP